MFIDEALIKFGRDSFTNWLYGDYNESKYRTFSALYAVPGLHDYMDYLLDRRSDQEYMDRYGIDYSRIHDPRRLSQSSSASRVLNSVSRNVDRLYR